MSSYRLLIGGYEGQIHALEFSPLHKDSERRLKITSSQACGKAPTWLTLSEDGAHSLSSSQTEYSLILLRREIREIGLLFGRMGSASWGCYCFASGRDWSINKAYYRINRCVSPLPAIRLFPLISPFFPFALQRWIMAMSFRPSSLCRTPSTDRDKLQRSFNRFNPFTRLRRPRPHFLFFLPYRIPRYSTTRSSQITTKPRSPSWSSPRSDWETHRNPRFGN